MFTRLVSELDYPVFIVTASAGGEPAGCLVGFATQTSIHPPRFLACISRKNRTHEIVRRAPLLAVHFVSEDDRDLAQLFGGETGDQTAKFDRCDWHPGPEGVPLLDDIPNRFIGRILDRIDLGDHTGVLLAPIDLEKSREVRELRFQQAKHIPPGHEP